ncbi:MAG TPA: aldo/keto reductase [Bryobacteraceae bacterium]|jgi:aryl-alcohol dehydrogenase-like predicted oxidoreductase
MNTRTFGRTGWQVSELGYGMWGMAGWTGSDDQESLQSLERAVELGCTFFDTAWAYGEGHSERLLGQIFRSHPSERLYAATKIPPKNRKWPARPEFTLDDCYPPEYIDEYVDRSLANTGLPVLDLIQLHTWSDEWLQDERFVPAIEKLRQSGKVRAVGISLNRWEPWNGIEAVRAGVVDSVQVVYNIFDQNPEDELYPACRAANVAVIARVPLDEGSLTGTLTADFTWPSGDWRNLYFNADNLKATLGRVEALRTLVPEGSTLADMALRFVLSNPDVATVIPGMRRLRHVEANVAASEAGPLDAAVLTALRAHRWDRRQP